MQMKPLLLLSLAILPASMALADASDYVASLHGNWFTPRAMEFARDSRPLPVAIEALCAAPGDASEAKLAEARRQWRSALLSWERLAAVAIGPVLRDSLQRKLDFSPTRPKLIEKAIKSAPKTPTEMDLIGTPGKGFPALEWLLWVQPAQPGSAACAYATQVALEITRTAETLATTPAMATDNATALNDLLNQWIAGLERLRWGQMVKPLQMALTSGKTSAPDYFRLASGASEANWQALWGSLRELAIGPGAGPASIAALLRQRDKSNLADSLAQAVRRADAAMARVSIADNASIQAASKELLALRYLIEGETAPALGVSIGFANSDGD